MSLTTAKVFMNGRSQAIRLPREFRVSASEVYITREEDRIIIVPKPERFNSRAELETFFNAIHCPDFELNRDTTLPQSREV